MKACFVAVMFVFQVSVAIADEQARLDMCLDRVDADPEQGYQFALDWLLQGGRPAARHCVAMALSALGHTAEAAARLEALANAPDAGSVLARAGYLALAGNMWILARQPDAAVVALTSALKLRRGDSGLLTDRARAHLMNEDWTAAIDDLEPVLVQDRNNAVALHLRALASVGKGNRSKALADVERAITLDPENLELLVLRGQIRAKQRVR